MIILKNNQKVQINTKINEETGKKIEKIKNSKIN